MIMVVDLDILGNGSGTLHDPNSFIIVPIASTSRDILLIEVTSLTRDEVPFQTTRTIPLQDHQRP